MAFLHKNRNFSKSKKGTKAKNQIKDLNNKGFWQYSFFQKNHDPNNEAKIKVLMKPTNCFDPRNIHNYINPEKSKEQKIEDKYLNNEKLNSKEKIIYDSYIRMKNTILNKDIELIKINGHSAKPETVEGKLRLILLILSSYLKEENREIDIANIYLRLMDPLFDKLNKVKNEYKTDINKMNAIVKKLDLIELQFIKFHSSMPPLNTKGFVKFDDWQIQVIKNIDDNISTVINAPTSAGKTVLSVYAAIKGKSLFIVPTDALAWQVSSYIGSVLDINVPILTQTFQSIPDRDKMIELLNKTECIVGTAEIIIDYLPFIKNNFKWLIFDEIHMIGKPEGSGMELIAKVLNNVPILALSATIGNTDHLVNWLSKLQQKPANKVVCDKRFFNMQKFQYDSSKDILNSLHPLSLIDEHQIEDGSILLKSLQPTPPTTWSLYLKLKKNYKLEELDAYKFFPNYLTKRIELDEANNYFYKLINFIVLKYKEDKTKIMKIVNSYKIDNLQTTQVNLVKLVYKLKNEDKLPAIIFQKNTISCLRLAYNFSKDIDLLETEKYPKLITDRLKLEKKVKRQEKNEDKKDDYESRKDIKKSFGTIKLKKDEYNHSSIEKNSEEAVSIPLQEPHDDFNLNNTQYFNFHEIENWNMLLKKYFPPTGDYYHFIIKLLWRGVGVYAKGLPDSYLRIVQTLACQKKLALVFSDLSLVFGISMPFRTVIIMHDSRVRDNLDAMLYHQMAGRAGRRGLDKEGNIVFAGYSWDRIKELSISEAPIVTGVDNAMYSILHANEISIKMNTEQEWYNTCSNMLNGNNELLEESIQLNSNLSSSWRFGFVTNNINHLHMNWRLRYVHEGILISFLLPYLHKAFDNKDHTKEINQINIAHFLARFIAIKSNENYLLDEPEILKIEPYNQISRELSILQINIPDKIDNRVFKSIQYNTIGNFNEDTTNEIRENLYTFSEIIKIIQHYCYHSNLKGLCRLLGKLLTRLWWIYHTSSPIIKYNENQNLKDFDFNLKDKELKSDSESKLDSETESETESESKSESETDTESDSDK